MSYSIDPTAGDIIIQGFENGIGDSPYSGLTDERNINIISVPGEASVNFSTAKISAPQVTNGSVDTSDAALDTIHVVSTVGLENYSSITFSATTIGGVSTNTVYWLGNQSGSNFQLFSDYGQTALVNITSNGTGTFSTYTMNIPKYFVKDTQIGFYWMVDGIGQVWSNTNVTSTNSYWTFTGNKVPSSTNTAGNGLVYYEASKSTDNTVHTGYLFVIHNSSIDYTKTALGTFGWQYQWNPANGVVTGYASTPNSALKTQSGVKNSHEALVPPDSRVYFCDSNWIDRFYQTDPATPFDPTNTATYTWDQTELLPVIDIAQCLTFLGTNLMIGGQMNIVYPWDRFDTQFNYPIFVAESNIVKMITVNTNTYMLVGNRGRVYITNGTQAQLYKKVPDHLSGTIEPYYTWGGLVSTKNQLYFSLSATSNAGVAIPQYGALWAVDLDSNAMRIVNELSYGTYAGYATALIAQTSVSSNPTGTGLYIGWYDGVSAYGIDKTISTPYTAGQAYVISDAIPIGTLLKPTTSEQFEYKLSTPLLTGESVELQVASSITGSFTSLGITTGDGTQLSDIFPNAVQLQQWLLVKAILTAKSSSPSFNRLVQLRVIGATVKDNVASQPFGLQ